MPDNLQICSIGILKIGAFLMWVINLRDMLDDSLLRPAHRRFSAKVKKLGQIICYATAIEARISIDFKPRCWRRPKRKSCEGVLEIELRKDFIHWHCPACGDEGVLTGWRGLMWDMTEFRSPIES